MTMHVKIEKYQDDGYQARVQAVDQYNGEASVSDVGLLKKQGESVTVYCTTTRSLQIVEEVLDAGLPKAAEPAPADPAGMAGADETVAVPAIETSETARNEV